MNLEAPDQINTETAPNYERAIDILSALEKEVGPANLAFFVTPNTILTLSGARAHCDGVFYGESDAQLAEWLPKIQTSIEALRSITDIISSDAYIDKSVRGENYAGYDLKTRSGLIRSVSASQLLDTSAINGMIEAIASPDELSLQIRGALRKNPKLQGLSDDDINYVYIGIMLGYPDEAIMSSLHKWDEDPSSADDPLIDARIAYADYYDCPQPVYSYPQSLKGNPKIIEHEKLWSSILKGFYRSSFHNKLASNPEFQKMAKAIGLSDKQA